MGRGSPEAILRPLDLLDGAQFGAGAGWHKRVGIDCWGVKKRVDLTGAGKWGSDNSGVYTH